MGTTLSLESGLAAANTAFKAGYEEYFGGGKTPPGAHPFYCGEEPMTTETKRYDWLANFPVMERWVGPRRFGYLREYNQTIVLGPAWVQTLPIKRRLMQTDATGAVARGIQSFIKTQAGAFDKDASTLYLSATGAGPTGYDGVAIFSASHPHGPSGNQSNISAGTALSPAALSAADIVMRGLRLENNEPAGVDPDTLIVGPALKDRALAIVGANVETRIVAVNASGAEVPTASTAVAAAAPFNIYSGMYKLVVDNRRPSSGTGAFYWELRDSKLPPPIMRHVFRAPEPQHQDQMGSFCRFVNDEFWFGVEGDWVTDAGFWAGSHRGTGTA